MFCGKCGSRLDTNSKFCPNCGNNNPNFQEPNNIVVTSNPVITKSTTKKTGIIIAAIFGVLWLGLLTFIIVAGHNSDYYFDDGNNPPVDEKFDDLTKIPGESVKRDRYGTAYIYDNTYYGKVIDDLKTAKELIEKDSNEQKSTCPKEINAIEERIMKENNVIAVNLCEMDVDTAKSFADALKRLWSDYPGAKGYLSNIGVFNIQSMKDNYTYAFFQPAFTFEGYSDSYINKVQVELNSGFYFNLAKLDRSLAADVKMGFHPKNTDNRYSIVIHELGHYIEFALTLKEYGLDNALIYNNDTALDLNRVYNDWKASKTCLNILNNAYNQNKTDKNITLSFDEWRATVSAYAVTKDNEGNYIYHETIAEAISDYDVNRQNASDASIYIVKEIQNRFGR